MDLLPFQFKIAISWICGFFILQFMTPLVFKMCGPVSAGKYGMSLQIMYSLTGFANVWMSSKVPLFGRLVADLKFVKLNSIFKKNLLISSMVLIFLWAIFFGCFYFFSFYYPDFFHRMLDLNLFLYLSIVSILHHITVSESYYLRSFKDDPFMYLSIISAFTIVVSSFYFISKYSLLGSVIALLVNAIFVNMIIGNIIFYIYAKNFLNKNFDSI